jgi:hypothetical protein
MNLDRRIKSKSDILTSFDVENAKSFLGQKGYFEDYFHEYKFLGDSEYGILTEVLNDEVPFQSDDGCHWRFFIPESLLKQADKLTLDEVNYKCEKCMNEISDIKAELISIKSHLHLNVE